MHPAGRPPPHQSTQDFARAVQGLQGQTARLQRGVELVVQVLEGCDHAGVSVGTRREVITAAATDDVVERGDTWQYELGEGPCLDAVRHQNTVISHDLRTDDRWPLWGPRVIAGLGINAMMSLLLYTRQDTIGALNLYADRSRAWDADQIAAAHALAGHLAVAVADAREIEGRGRAMISRTVIGQAEGIIMERFGISADRAFDYLRRISQHHNRKLIAVAEELVATRSLPDASEQEI